MSYHFIEISDVLMVEHNLMGKAFDLIADDSESAENTAIFTKGVHAMAAALMELVNKEKED